MSMQIKMTLELPVKVVKKEKWYVASCPALDVVSQGDTREEARLHLGEALFGFLASCFEHGTLEAVLRECGFSPVLTDKPTEAKVSEADASEETIDVPLYLLAKYVGSDHCHHA